MKVYLRLPGRPETAVHLGLVPKAGENIDYGGLRYVVVSVIHTVETAKTVLELAGVNNGEQTRAFKSSDALRYRTSEIRAFSPVVRRYSGP